MPVFNHVVCKCCIGVEALFSAFMLGWLYIIYGGERLSIAYGPIPWSLGIIIAFMIVLPSIFEVLAKTKTHKIMLFASYYRLILIILLILTSALSLLMILQGPSRVGALDTLEASLFYIMPLVTLAWHALLIVNRVCGFKGRR